MASFAAAASSDTDTPTASSDTDTPTASSSPTASSDTPTASSAAAATPSYDVVFSYQGAFGPPTYGHYKSMEAFADNLTKEFSNKKILMLFMPTAGGSKSHLRPTRIMRKNVLDMFCNMLNGKFTNITFETSGIENEIFDAEETKNKTTTIYTIKKLKAKYPTSTICLGMGLDNAYQLPYWQDIDKYVDLVHKIYVVPRTPSAEEEEKTRKFTVTNTAESTAEPTAKTTVEMRFDITVPWKNDTFLNCFLPPDSSVKDPNNKNVLIPVTRDSVTKDVLIEALNSVNDDKEPYKFRLTLPPVVELKNEETTSTSAASTPNLIPATSSSMMRYFIGQYIQNNKHLEKIQKLMFGPDVLIENPTGGPTVSDKTNIVMDTINDYRDNVFDNNFPKDPNENNSEKTYEKQYGNLKFSGGNRKTKRRRTNKKRRSQRKKRRSQRK